MAITLAEAFTPGALFHWRGKGQYAISSVETEEGEAGYICTVMDSRSGVFTSGVPFNELTLIQEPTTVYVVLFPSGESRWFYNEEAAKALTQSKGLPYAAVTAVLPPEFRASRSTSSLSLKA